MNIAWVAPGKIKMNALTLVVLVVLLLSVTKDLPICLHMYIA